MKFSDFENPQDLVGKTVLYESGQTYSEHRRKSIVKIEKVTNTGFRVSTMPDTMFSLIDGTQKGLTGRINMGTISECKLITDEQANELRQQWRRIREEKELREKIQEKLKTMSLEKLQLIDLI